MNKITISGLMLAALLSSNLRAAGDYSVAAGAEYSSGDYGTGSTATLISVPFVFSYQGERWGWGITVPYVTLRSSGNVVVGGSGMMSTSPATTTGGGGMGPGGGGGTATASATTTEAGLGDTTLRLSMLVAEEGGAMPGMVLTLKAKVATADETRNLGTGENDYAAQLEMAKGVADGYLGYKVLGDTATIDFNNVAYGALAFSYKQSKETRYSLEGYMEQPAVSGMDGKREVSLSFDHWLDEDKKVSLYLLKGFSDASPDWGGGVRFKSFL